MPNLTNNGAEYAKKIIKYKNEELWLDKSIR
jgi:hypothetical protein